MGRKEWGLTSGHRAPLGWMKMRIPLAMMENSAGEDKLQSYSLVSFDSKV